MNDQPRLPLRVQVGYATADVGLNTVEFLLRLWVLAFYTDVVGLEVGLAGLAAAIAIAWDAFADPVMGVISDRTRHRFGGRRGYLPAGGVLLAIGTIAVFCPPTLDGQAAKFGWLLASYSLLNTGLTVLSVPYMAMAGEMTGEPHERTALFGWRFAFANLGALAAAALPALWLDGGTTMVSAMPAVSIVTAVLVVATALCSWAATKRVHFLSPPLLSKTMLGAFTAPLRNRPFRPLLAAYIVASVGIGINAATFRYYYQHVLELEERQTANVLTVFMVVFTVSIAAWVLAAKRWGKRRPLIAGAVVLGAGNTALYVLAPAGGYAWVMGFGAFGLAAFVGCIVLIDTMLTDVLDHDLLRTGRLRSGLFFGVWRFASKIARAAAFVIVGAVLSLAGFVERAASQPPGVDRALTWLFGPGVGALFLATGLLLWSDRFDERAQDRVRRLLARRTGRGRAVDGGEPPRSDRATRRPVGPSHL